MASEVKTNNISPATGTSVTFSGLNVGSDAQGDILYHDGTDYTRLGAGTSGHFLKTQGTSANPVWAADSAGSLVYLASSRSTVNAATVNFQEFRSTDYLFYMVTGFIRPVTNAIQLDIRLMDGASAITTSNYVYIRGGVDSDGTANHTNSSSNDNWTVAGTVSNTAPLMFTLQLHFQDATDDGWDGAIMICNLGCIHGSIGGPSERTVFGTYPIDNANIDGIQFYQSSGDVDCHKIAVYGMKGS